MTALVTTYDAGLVPWSRPIRPSRRSWTWRSQESPSSAASGGRSWVAASHTTAAVRMARSLETPCPRPWPRPNSVPPPRMNVGRPALVVARRVPVVSTLYQLVAGSPTRPAPSAVANCLPTEFLTFHRREQFYVVLATPILGTKREAFVESPLFGHCRPQARGGNICTDCVLAHPLDPLWPVCSRSGREPRLRRSDLVRPLARSSFLGLTRQLESSSYILFCSAVRRAWRRASSAASFAAFLPNPTPMT